MSSRPVRLTVAAEQDLLEAVNWYRKEAPHVVPRFRQRVREAFKRIGGKPLHFPAVHGEVRRALVHGFRQVILFRLLPESIQVIAVLHSSRDPLVWQSR
jgi:plasmid stabilization system protein ParE